MRLTALAHELVARHLVAGDLAVDVTAGNGHDTLFLAKTVGADGHVRAFDIQLAALESTRRRLESHGVGGRVELIHASNARLAEFLPPDARGEIGAVMANLGYLPGGDTAVVTHTMDTLRMLDTALGVLRPGGVISVLAYPGHPGGDLEAAAVFAWLKSHANESAALEIHGEPESPARTPWLGLLVKV